ncbi:hypothetical protein A2697_00350 [Candidatus Curtissbacteria bacterium RIFCSPHIGHO2_01_FULL_41_44]|uniref:Regulatory protein RecX n=1 Tax=Candidatus Curtissbacteria bacterium RIFCSPLOWO2_01_FULL_42_50 TaxID=1797730 RepID=A0A1F5H6L5_9BACT|nr:MAG: hypothetical protein A2697_00350 [Candidatus Curtissbacteria bacterium RIFCSPHIGHO2_01_FULL_41_44]OGD93995.1 MAG: hypothetical protein A3C33_00015 [Candidatus Curtissbacteria bacterium RIFCSPHIGHO2_02_FULL_42_58]OGD97646.1 MAG: hypothetical protein A3E71_01860 [Candidatus Curtissbacteria bacterium RIFCSPHIGHO2_12_FULL_42_33]OGD99760.1 MAG: hypothetical protein A3B54_01030 [Candidatus Curtissbacteria bacterium RIFCSPLOWO2_01_FULL_42_50]OGE03859.1 MAG: hypothetical protein A3G16_00560 [Ca
MPQITAIEPQKKKDRFNVYIDGRFAFGIDENVLVKNRLKINQQLTGDQVQNLIKETILGKFTDQALRFLSYRPRSKKEVVDYLVKKISQNESVKYDRARESPLIAKIIAKLTRYGYLNDLEFALWWFSARTKSKPKGPALIKAELVKKGIDKDTIENILPGQVDQVGFAKKAVEKKLKKWHGLPGLEFKKKFYSYLAGRGFDFDTIKETFAFLTKRR